MEEKKPSQENCKVIDVSNSVLQTLNVKHHENLSKLKEINIRLNNSVLFLGGAFTRNATEESAEQSLFIDSHVSNYNDLLNSTECVLNKIFEEIQRLEYLVVDTNHDQ